jgi:predicted transposase/invertase (TIGR01784 family)
MDNSKLPTPHNHLFHYALSHPQAARDLIQTHLPSDLVAAMDLDSLKLQKDTFIDEELRECYSDLLYWVQLADHDGKRCQGQVYLLLEHKSHSDPMTCFQLLRYIVRIWEQRLRSGQPLCPVFPLVVYHGQEAWSSPLSLEDLVGGPRNLFHYGVRLAYPVLDLGKIPDESLAGEPFLQSILGLLKYSRRRDFEQKLEFLLRCLLEGGTKDLYFEHLNAVVVYITTVSPSISVETLEMTIQKIFQTQIEPGSIADEYIQRGRLQGLQEGKIQLIQTLQEILGLPASEASTLEHRSLEQLQAITAELRQQIRDRS